MKRKTRKVLKYIVLPLLIILAAAAFYIYKEYNRVHKDTARLKPDYTTTAVAFLAEYQANEQASNRKYWDKVVKVQGLVKKIEKDDRGFYSIVLGDTASTSSVRCSIDSSHTNEVAVVKEGSQIIVKGICSGYNVDELLGSDILLVRGVVDNK